MFDKKTPFTNQMNSIFNQDDILKMVNIPDEAACVLKAHLVLEGLVDAYCGSITNTDDLFSGAFFAFKLKLSVAKNLGLNNEIYVILDKVNDIRNRFSHRKKYSLEDSSVEGLKNRVNSFLGKTNINNCEDFVMIVGGALPNGERHEIHYKWSGSDNRQKFVLCFSVLMIKLVWWVQEDLKSKGIACSFLPIKYG